MNRQKNKNHNRENPAGVDLNPLDVAPPEGNAKNVLLYSLMASIFGLPNKN